MPTVDQLLPAAFTELHGECLALVLSRIVDYYGARLVSLAVFGSYARRQPRFDSDLDLLSVLRSGTGSRLSQRAQEFVTNVDQPCDGDLIEGARGVDA